MTSFPLKKTCPSLGRYVPAVALGGACAVAALTEAGADDGVVLCPYRLATGGWCPGCGGTRAVKHLFHGDMAMATSMNPWALLVLVQATVVATLWAARPERTRTWWHANSGRVLLANVVVALSSWFLRLGVGEIPLPFG